MRRTLRILVLTGVLAIVAVATYEAATWPGVRALAVSNPTTTAFIERYVARERRAGRSGRVAWRWVPYSRISTHLKRAVLVAEDIDFFSHNGFAAGEIEGVSGNGAEVTIGPGSGPPRKVVIRTDSDADGDISDNPAFESFYPYGSSYRGGVRLGAGDTDHSGFFVEVMTAPGTNAGSATKKVKVYDDDGDASNLLSDNPRDDSFVSMPSSVRAGAYVALARVRLVPSP